MGCKVVGVVRIAAVQTPIIDRNSTDVTAGRTKYDEGGLARSRSRRLAVVMGSSFSQSLNEKRALRPVSA